MRNRRDAFTVALIGPDGAGKTTVAHRLEPALGRPVKYLYMGVSTASSNRALPFTRLLHAIKRKLGAAPDTAGPKEHRADSRPRNPVKRGLKAVKSLAGLGLRVVEEWYRQLLAWRYQRAGAIVLFDRHYYPDFYAYDIANTAEPKSLARRLHGWMLEHVYPKPDLVIYLDAPAELLFSRKGEGSVELLERRRQDYFHMAELMPSFAVVNASQPLDAVVAQTAARITDFADTRRNASAAGRGRASGRVLVTDANRGSAVAIIRSLSRAGYTAIAADSVRISPGRYSRHATDSLLYPDPETHPAEYSRAMLDAVERKEVDLVIPVTESASLPLIERAEWLSLRSRLAIPDHGALETARNKRLTVGLAERLGVPAPRTIVVSSVREAEAAGSSLGWPIVLKPEVSRLPAPDGRIERLEVTFAENPAELIRRLTPLEGRCQVLLQEYYPGQAFGVELLLDRGRVLAAFQHKRLREFPVQGGPSSLREAAPLDPEMYSASARLLEALHWTGLAMVEFKSGKDGPKLMEINGRVWGSLPLAVAAGVPFPALLADLCLNQSSTPVTAIGRYSVGTRCRNLELEIKWIASVLAQRRKYLFLDYPRRRDAFAAAFQLLHPGYYTDVLSWTDPVPGLCEAFRIVGALLRKVSKNTDTPST